MAEMMAALRVGERAAMMDFLLAVKMVVTRVVCLVASMVS